MPTSCPPPPTTARSSILAHFPELRARLDRIWVLGFMDITPEIQQEIAIEIEDASQESSPDDRASVNIRPPTDSLWVEYCFGELQIGVFVRCGEAPKTFGGPPEHQFFQADVSGTPEADLVPAWDADFEAVSAAAFDFVVLKGGRAMCMTTLYAFLDADGAPGILVSRGDAIAYFGPGTEGLSTSSAVSASFFAAFSARMTSGDLGLSTRLGGRLVK